MSIVEIKMPKLGESVTEGLIVSWAVKVGDVVHEDDTLFEVNTSKVSAEIPSPVSGKITEIFSQEGDTVEVGKVVAHVEVEGDAPSEEKKEEAIVPEQEEIKENEATWFSPAVLTRAKEAGLGVEELSSIQGSGQSGRVTRDDVDRYLEGKTARPEQQSTLSVDDRREAGKGANGDEVIPMDAVRRIIAERMVASKRISPHVTSVLEADVTRLVRWREENKERFYQKEGVKMTYMPAVTEAVAQVLKRFPRINSSVDGDRIIQKCRIHIGIATSLDDGNLIVPVIRNADQLQVDGLAVEISRLADKARSGKLAPDDVEGGTFTISNFGSNKTLFGTPIINQPEVAVLGMGMIEKKPVVIETPEGDVIAVRYRMYLSLSYDHRIIDGALAGSFLRAVADYLEHWKEH